MKNEMKKLILILFLFIPLVLFSQKITLEYLIDKGLQNSLDIMQNENDLASQKTNLITSYLTLLPSASVSASKSYPNGEENNISAGFSLGESFSWNDGRYFSIKNAIISKKNAELNFQNKKRNFIYSIFSKYIAILQAEKNLEIQKENLKIQKNLLERTKLKYESGEANKLDYQQAQISFLSMKIDINKAKNDIENLRYDLFSLVGIEDEKQSLADIRFDINKLPEIKNFEENNEIKIEKNNLIISELSLLQQKLNLFPSLSVGFSYNYSSSPYYDFLNFDNYMKSHSISISFSYGLFDIPTKKLNFNLAKRRFYLQKLFLDKKIKDTKNEVSKMKKDLEALYQTYRMQKEKLSLAKENFKMAKEQYDAGYISLLDYDRSKIDFMNSKISYNRTYYNIILKLGQIDMKLSQKIFGKW
jgi:multidrug efflux system outer membrane protein